MSMIQEYRPNVQRFPRLRFFPRFIDAETRNAVGTLMCICGKPGKHFYSEPQQRLVKRVDGSKLNIGYQLRGFCGDECHDIYLVNTNQPSYHWRVKKMSKNPGWLDFKREE